MEKGRYKKAVMRLIEIFNVLNQKPQINVKDEKVTGITSHSKQVEPGCVFVCIKGFKHDGHRFAKEAVERGAIALVVEYKLSDIGDVPQIIVSDSRCALAQLSAEFWDHPSKKLTLVGVTGTNGKTTTTYLVESIFAHADFKTGLIGTIMNKIGDKVFPIINTTPESEELQKAFYDMKSQGTDMAVMEVSSHALDLHRVDTCFFNYAVFTNLTQDHLDYHVTLERYLEAKGRLFTELLKPEYNNAAIINMDDPSSDYLIEHTQAKVITYGLNKKAHIRAENVEINANGASFTIIAPGINEKISLQLTGFFNVYNALSAFCVGFAAGIPFRTIKKGLESVKGVPGRFELIQEGQEFAVIVDYAHTPDGLENILKTAQAFVQGRIISVFGCGGDRDCKKRPLMGKISAELADYSIITSDNPRTEEPSQIIKDIEAGVKALTDDRYEVISDRRKAIERALSMAQKNDVIIIAGKGHETYQIIGTQKYDFDDREITRDVLRRMKNG